MSLYPDAQGSNAFDAIGQAALKAEQAALTWKANTAPFLQLDFETEHPEWSFSARRSSSVNSSRPGSANGTSASLSRSSISSASNTIPTAELVEHAALVSQATRSPSLSLEDIRSYNERKYNARANGRTQAKAQTSYSKRIPRSPSSATASCHMIERNRQAHGVYHYSANPEGILPDVAVKEHIQQARNPVSDPDPEHNVLSGCLSGTRSQNEALWLTYQELLDHIIQSLNSRFEELCPQSSAPAMRQEVLEETIQTLLPDLLREKEYPNKRQRKLIRRFVKELWGRKITHHFDIHEEAKGGISRAASEARSSSSRLPSLSTMGAGEDVMKPSRGTRPSFVDQESYFESIDLSPDPENRPTLRSGNEVVPPPSQVTPSASGPIESLSDDDEYNAFQVESIQESPSNQLALTGAGYGIKQEPCSDAIKKVRDSNMIDFIRASGAQSPGYSSMDSSRYGQNLQKGDPKAFFTTEKTSSKKPFSKLHSLVRSNVSHIERKVKMEKPNQFTTSMSHSHPRHHKPPIKVDGLPSTDTLLRRRLYGMDSQIFTQQQLRTACVKNITLQRSWKGASGDIVSAAWHLDSQRYVVGAIATSNAEDLHYNRPNNLLYGDANHNTLHELPDHRVDRPRPDTIAQGPNASEAVYHACDPKVYKTVSAVQFSPERSRLYTASHDQTLKIWDVRSEGLPSCIKTIRHEARLTQLNVSSRIPNTIAIGSQIANAAIHVYYQATLESPYERISLGSLKAQAKPQHEIYPECLQWGSTPMTENLLLAGFARWGELPDNDPGRDGELCVWDINTAQRVKKTPSSQSVTTATFHPFLDAFATGGSAGTRITHRYTTKTVVRMWDMRTSGFIMELECPALDMQDLVFHRQQKDVVALGCTDGAAYLWDARKPDYLLHRLQHGQPIADWDHKYGSNPMSREQGDAGVTLTLWGGNNQLYTGATDGLIKRWDIRYAPEDALISDVAQLAAGVSCGSFSPDDTSLLVGDSTGGVHLIMAGPGYLSDEEQKSHTASIQYIPARRNQPPSPASEPGQGQLAAENLLSSGQLTMHPVFGVGQGPAYSGPYAAYAHEVGPPSITRLLKEVEKQQPVSRKDGHVRHNKAAQDIPAMLAGRRYELKQACERDEKEARKHAPETNDNRRTPFENRKRKHSQTFLEVGIMGAHKKAKPDIVDLTSDAEEAGEGPVKPYVKQEDVQDRIHEMTKDTHSIIEEDFEDDHYFPYMDVELFKKLALNG